MYDPALIPLTVEAIAAIGRALSNYTFCVAPDPIPDVASSSDLMAGQGMRRDTDETAKSSRPFVTATNTTHPLKTICE